MPAFRSLDDVALEGRKVLLRVDLNVPIENGVVRDATRIERIVPTIRELIAKGASVILLAHFDRPKGKVVPEMSLAPVAPALAKALGQDVRFVFTDWLDNKAEEASAALKPGEVILLENTRFAAGEEKNDAALSVKMAKLGDLFVNDAFSAAHRAHASTEGVAHHVEAVAGRAMQAELKALAAALETPKRPVMAVVGGAKISTKLDLLGNLTAKVDVLVIGGGMANTFLAAQGVKVGKSLCEKDLLDTAREIMANAAAKGCKIMLPSDVVLAKEFKAGAENRVADAHDVGADEMILDAGPNSRMQVKAALDQAGTLVWNGPFGAFEIPPFDAATNDVARHAENRTKLGKLISIAGGGDTVSALNQAGAAGGFTYVSTAGGAFLEWLEGKTLPGVKALYV